MRVGNQREGNLKTLESLRVRLYETQERSAPHIDDETLVVGMVCAQCKFKCVSWYRTLLFRKTTTRWDSRKASVESLS